MQDADPVAHNRDAPSGEAQGDWVKKLLCSGAGPRSSKCVYKQFDTDRSGTIGSSELPGAFEAAGFRLNEQLYQMIVRRYSDENGQMDFDNFISCLVRLDAMFRLAEAKAGKGTCIG
ncbi:calpain small subunit 1-like [Mauremys mutica]|uniref:calpain small subunit 1-like n=1 Tax=Mauremys mutica TaxID=74926 RepID=UPI001D164CF3|nr:calpain small subunit 1-like [Mauremys mutica]